jgi:hypothetical protein
LNLSCFIEKFSGFLGIVIVDGHVFVVGPVMGRQDAPGQGHRIFQKHVGDFFPVDGIGDGPSYVPVLKYRVFQVKSQIVAVAARFHADLDVIAFLEERQVVGEHGVLEKMHFSPLQRHYARAPVGYDAENYLFEPGRLSGVMGIADQHDFPSRLEALDLKRAGTEGGAGELSAFFRGRLFRYYPHGKLGEQGSIGLLQLHGHFVLAGFSQLGDLFHDYFTPGVEFGVCLAFQCIDHVVRGKECAVGELSAFLNAKHEGGVVLSFKGLDQLRPGPRVFVYAEESLEDEGQYPQGVGVLGYAGVQHLGVCFETDHNFSLALVPVFFAAPCEHGEEQNITQANT